MPKGVLCKFFVHGACLKGDHCEFSHDWKDQANNVCTFYQKGVCTYGRRCRYDHVKVSRFPSSISSSSSTLGSSLIKHSSGSTLRGETANLPTTPVELSALSEPFFPPNRPAWNQESVDFAISGNGFDENSATVGASDRPICAFAAAGKCPHGDNCPQMHGDLCPTCGKNCLHPYRPDEREEHINQCQINSKRLEALIHSQEIECSVCLERVLSKGTPAERKFGILSECDHPFCISCIRNWRGNSPASGMDVNSVLRACPICRKLSYFVIPSVIWYSSKEEKQEIVDSYKNTLRSIDCKHFDFGNGTCPFGTSCFYKHAYRDGRIEEVTLRHLGAEDGNTVIAKDIRFKRSIGDFECPELLNLIARINTIKLDFELEDRLSLNLDPSGRFSLKSMYKFLANANGSPHPASFKWNFGAPPRPTSCAWLVVLDKAPIKDYLRR